MSHPHFSHLSDPEKPCVDGAPTECDACGAPLCLRKQVINLALGNTDEMLCLECLGKDNDQSAQEVLESVKEYVYRRECFRKEWLRYPSVKHCPDRKGCFPDACFKNNPKI
jgi:hypothetical protein